MTGRRQEIVRFLLIVKHALLYLFLSLGTTPAQSQNAESVDPFPICMEETGNDDVACLARQGGWYDWRPTKASCRFVGTRVDSIIKAGGQAKWRDLFRNERCARLNFPHGSVAAAAGGKVVPDHPYARCLFRNSGFGSSCDESMGRHSFYPSTTGRCVYHRRALRERQQEQEEPGSLSLGDPFENERCWRLGLPHFESK